MLLLPTWFRGLEKPTEKLRVNRHHALSKCLTHAIYEPYAHDTEGRAYVIPPPEILWSGDEYGSYFAKSSDPGSSYLSWPNNTGKLSGTTPRTILIVHKIITASQSGRIFSIGTNSAGQRDTFRYSTGSFRFEVSGGAYNSSLSPSLGVHVSGYTFEGTTIADYTLWLDGVSEAVTGTTSINTGTDEWTMLGDPFNGGSGRGVTDQIYGVFGWDRKLSDLEIQAFSRDPWMLLEPVIPKVSFVPDAAGGVTVNVPTGSVTFTGLAPDVLTPVSVNIPVGALTLTGLAPVANVSVLTNVPAGALSLTGFAPTVNATQNVNVDIPTGTLTLTGLLPQVVAPQSVDVPAGSMLLTAFTPAINVSILTNVPTGTMTFSGLAPAVDITDNQLVDVPTGSMLFAGFAPTVELAGPVSVEVPTGSLTMSGFAPIILADSIVWTVQPDVTTTWNPQSDSTTIWTEV